MNTPKPAKPGLALLIVRVVLRLTAPLNFTQRRTPTLFRMRSELLCLIGNHDQCDKSYDYTDKRFVTISCMASGEKITESHREDVPVSIKFGSAPDSWDINED